MGRGYIIYGLMGHNKDFKFYCFFLSHCGGVKLKGDTFKLVLKDDSAV